MKTLVRQVLYRMPGYLDWRLKHTMPLAPWNFVAGGRSYELQTTEDWVHKIRNDDGLGKLTGVDREGRYEAAFCDMFISKLNEKTVFLDIGAAHGLYSIIAARTCPPGQIHCFEPDPASLWVLRINNNRYCGGQLNITPQSVGRGGEKESVSLDDYCERLGLRPTLVKLDIEGAEILALAGMRRVCTKYRPIIIMEYHLRKLRQNWKTDPEDVVKMLRSYGYRLKFNGHHGYLVQSHGQKDPLWHDRLPNEVSCAVLAEPDV
jgi:hypothetical protein